MKRRMERMLSVYCKENTRFTFLIMAKPKG